MPSVEEIKQAIKHVDDLLEAIKIDGLVVRGILPWEYKAVRMAQGSLRAEIDQNQNEPLTINELAKIADLDECYGSHIWIRVLSNNQVVVAITDITEEDIVAVWSAHQESETKVGCFGYYVESNYGKTWLAYRYKPEED